MLRNLPEYRIRVESPFVPDNLGIGNVDPP